MGWIHITYKGICIQDNLVNSLFIIAILQIISIKFENLYVLNLGWITR